MPPAGPGATVKQARAAIGEVISGLEISGLRTPVQCSP